MTSQLLFCRRTLAVVVCALCLADCQDRSSGSQLRRLEFEDLRQADRIEVVGTASQVVATIGDPQRIRAATEFIERYHDGWIDYWSGPRAPLLVLQFFKGSRPLGHYGLSGSYLVRGSLSRDTPSADIEALAKTLQLEWPPGR